jgi:hypothetical protein
VIASEIFYIINCRLYLMLKKNKKIKTGFVITLVLFATMTTYSILDMQKGPIAPAFAMDLASGIPCSDRGTCSADPFGSGASECDCFENSYGGILAGHGGLSNNPQ